MHPALSVIAFTTLSGAGYGLLIWLGWLIPFHRLPLPPGYSTVALLLALTLITIGLLASLAHLGRPERAWRSLSQWRSSWLSREGVLAIATYLPAGSMLLVSIDWIDASHLRWLGPLSIVLALLTVYATSMIYASLRTVPAWNLRLVPALYLGFSLASGCLLATLLLSFYLPVERLRMPMFTAVISSAIAWAIQLLYWHRLDQLRPASAAAAVALAPPLRVRGFEKPHSEDSFVTREMVFRFARERSPRLRWLALVCGTVLSFGCIVIAAFVPASLTAAAMLLAGTWQLLAIFVSRWLFFAEARHVVSTYYDADQRR